MTLTSMTGFARSTGDGEDFRCIWELRSVNGKGLDVRLRLPSGCEGVEFDARSLVKKAFVRGNLTATLTVERNLMSVAPQINEAILFQYAEAAQALVERFPNIRAPSADGLLALRGAFDTGEDRTEELHEEKRRAVILGTLGNAVEALGTARAEEGGRTTTVITSMIERISSLAETAASIVEEQRDVLRERKAEAVRELLGVGNDLDPARLEQEVAILYTKADVREELDRLDGHIAQARELMDLDEAVGRRFDFLCQELNREANTLCSKAAISDLSRVGLDLKILIDQLREQVQNIE